MAVPLAFFVVGAVLILLFSVLFYWLGRTDGKKNAECENERVIKLLEKLKNKYQDLKSKVDELRKNESETTDPIIHEEIELINEKLSTLEGIEGDLTQINSFLMEIIGASILGLSVPKAAMRLVTNNKIPSRKVLKKFKSQKKLRKEIDRLDKIVAAM